MEKVENELKNISRDSVKFFFYCNDLRIVVLDNKKFDSKNKCDTLYLGKLVDRGDFDELVALTESEYDAAVKEYAKIANLFSEEKK